jgi:PPOX class probable F420-dependent enzyme
MVKHEYIARLTAARSARLATLGPDDQPHLVAIVFAYDDGYIYSAVDHKPKKSTDLKRLRNIAANPNVSVLVDHYEADWSRLWWVRCDGTARVVAAGSGHAHGLDLLVAKYRQYHGLRPPGPVIEIAVERINGWSAV